MTHPDRSGIDRRVQEAKKTLEEMVVPQSPAEWAMMAALGPMGGKAFKGASMAAGALASDDANAMFIGPKGIERLKALGKNVQEFPSRWFGTRAEVNPTDTSNVWWRMGGASARLDDLLKKNQTSAMLKDILPHEEFPELFEAYPELAKVPVKIRPSQFQQSTAASYRPMNPITDLRYSHRVAGKLQQKLEREFERITPRPTPVDLDDPDFQSKLAQYFEDSKEYELAAQQYPFTKLGVEEGQSFRDAVNKIRLQRLKERQGPGTITLNVPDQGYGDNPPLELVNSLLHEAQHGIQHLENNPDDFLTAYGDAEYVVSDKIKRAVSAQQYERNLDPLQYTDDGYFLRSDDDWKQNRGLFMRRDSVEANESEVRNWLDSLSWKEKQVVNPLLEDYWWPLSMRNLEKMREDLSNTVGGVDLSDQMPMDRFTVYRPEVRQEYKYKMNPYEREAVEASRRDTDPQYRKAFSRKTEELSQILSDPLTIPTRTKAQRYDDSLDDLLTLAMTLDNGE